MSPNGRRAWRKWVRRVEHNPKLRPPGKSISRLAREGKRHLGSIPPTPPKPFTSRSLVGMTQGARKRAAYQAAVTALGNDRAHAYTCEYGSYLRSGEYLGAYWTARARYRIGERLRPCPGCCACWGHRISSAYGEIAECCGPQTSGKRKSQIKAMRKWQETLADNCDGAGAFLCLRTEKRWLRVAT